MLLALLWDAPLEGLADPMQTPNPAKAPWYFLGLQELLHYFPPVVAGVLIPTLVVLALVAIPYFQNQHQPDEPCGRATERSVCGLGHRDAALLDVSCLLRAFTPCSIPTLLMAAVMCFSGGTRLHGQAAFAGWLSVKPLSFWIMSWFLLQAVVLTVIGTFFRGPGWSLVTPWRDRYERPDKTARKAHRDLGNFCSATARARSGR